MQYLRCGNLWRNIGESRKDYIMAFIDLEKAYDRVFSSTCMEIENPGKSIVGLTDKIPVSVGLHTKDLA